MDALTSSGAWSPHTSGNGPKRREWRLVPSSATPPLHGSREVVDGDALPEFAEFGDELQVFRVHLIVVLRLLVGEDQIEGDLGEFSRVGPCSPRFVVGSDI